MNPVLINSLISIFSILITFVTMFIINKYTNASNTNASNTNAINTNLLIKKCPNPVSNKFKLIREWNGSDLIPQNNKGWNYFMSPNWLSGPNHATGSPCGVNGPGGGNAEPTHSRSYYVDGLLSGNFSGSTSEQIHIDVIPQTNSINAVRIQSVEQFNNGLFTIDFFFIFLKSA